MSRSQPSKTKPRQPALTLTDEQAVALEAMDAFVQGDEKLYLLTGYAGTGKTTLLQVFIRNLRDRGDQRSIVLIGL
jgi:tRNA A37 threonylcarbamoyladenosine biosynthesis protein TsaE